MRLYADIFKHNGQDCTNGGTSDEHNECLVIFNETLDDIEKNPPNSQCIYVIVPGNVKGTIKAINFDEWLEKERGEPYRWSMFGGNFVFTSDGRFPSWQPIAIHDRYEN